MKLIRIYIIIATCILFDSCSTRQITKELEGTWVVEEFDRGNGDTTWEELKVNMITFGPEGLCKTPVRDVKKSDRAIWKVLKRSEMIYLVIDSAQDSIFNREFKVSFIDRKQGDATVKVLIMSSSELTMKCSK